MLLKCNTIIDEIPRVTQISSDFNVETNHSQDTFAGIKYLERFVNNVVGNFNQSSNSFNDSHIIPFNFLKEDRHFILIKIPLHKRIESEPKDLIVKLS